jgi:non-ribosomal peptide synthetase component F/acyl carrier protein
MNMASAEHKTDLALDQEAIRAKCFHPTGAFIEFSKEEIEQSIPERFEKIVRLYPDRVAVKTRSQQLSYNDLNRAANRLARAILVISEHDQEPLALFLEHGISPIIANLAVLKAGKFAVQTDPAAQRSRTAHLLEDSRATLLLTNEKSYSMAQEWATEKRRLINIDDLDSRFSDDNLGIPIPSTSPGSVRYTTGSTRQAKGSLKNHRHDLHTVAHFTNYFHICANDRIIMLGRHVLGKETFEALLNGAALYPFDLLEESLAALAQWLIQEQITIYKSFPAAFRQFVGALSDRESFPKLRLIRLAGEPVYTTDLELYRKHFSPDCVFVNAFSATETGNIAAYFADKNTHLNRGRVPVGYPIEGKEVLVVDDTGKEVGPNETGEIAVRSRFLSTGYWQRPELTREKFHSEPGTEEEQLYFTGDLGRMSKDGCLELLGRKDFEIKLRGSRVDVGETEAALGEHPGIKELAVVPNKLASGETLLVAYLVARDKSSAPTVTELRLFLKDKLPESMIPAAFVVLSKLPLLPTGKVDRRSLPEPERSRPELENPFVGAETFIQEKLAMIWAEVLNLDRVGIHDNFFDLGGHSLTASRIVSQVIKEFRLELSLRSLFQSPTVAAMAAIIDGHQDKDLPEGEMERILSEVESIREEEAQRLLSSDRKEPAKEIQLAVPEQHSNERRQ